MLHNAPPVATRLYDSDELSDSRIGLARRAAPPLGNILPSLCLSLGSFLISCFYWGGFAFFGEKKRGACFLGMGKRLYSSVVCPMRMWALHSQEDGVPAYIFRGLIILC
jgi:hypothetical protein